MWRLRPAVLLGAFWALRGYFIIRSRVRRQGMKARPPAPPALPAHAGRGVYGVLNRLSPTCLERALLLQSWAASQGDLRDVVIGLPKTGFGAEPAHAWIDGAEPLSADTFIELHRISPS